MKTKLLHILLLLTLLALFFTGCKKEDKAGQPEPTTNTVVVKKQLINKPRWVTADPSLRMRDSAGSEGSVIGNIPLGEEVTLLEESGDELTIAGATGRWSKVKWQELEGWVFGGFLTAERPVVEVETEENTDKVTDMWVTGVGIKLFDTNMTPIKVIPHATKLKVKNTIKDDLSTVYMGLPGQWLEVEWNGTEGLYFSAFLSEEEIREVELSEEYLIGSWELILSLENGIYIDENDNTYKVEYKNNNEYHYKQEKKDWGVMFSLYSIWKLDINNSIINYTNVVNDISGETLEDRNLVIVIIKNDIIYKYLNDERSNDTYISVYKKL